MLYFLVHSLSHSLHFRSSLDCQIRPLWVSCDCLKSTKLSGHCSYHSPTASSNGSEEPGINRIDDWANGIRPKTQTGTLFQTAPSASFIKRRRNHISAALQRGQEEVKSNRPVSSVPPYYLRKVISWRCNFPTLGHSRNCTSLHSEFQRDAVGIISSPPEVSAIFFATKRDISALFQIAEHSAVALRRISLHVTSLCHHLVPQIEQSSVWTLTSSKFFVSLPSVPPIISDLLKVFLLVLLYFMEDVVSFFVVVVNTAFN